MDRYPSNISTEIATTARPVGPGTAEPSVSHAELAAEYRRARPAELPAQVLTPGARLGERYEIVGKLGQGGMGVVYEARNANVEHIRYAIKTLLPGNTKADSQHFLQEAKRASRVRSPHVVQIFDFGTDAATGLVYMVMDYIGEDLERYAARCGGTLSPAMAVEFCAQACEGLAAAHAENVVHRDIKPLNCLLRVENGREIVVVTDFGIAREFQPAMVTQEGAAPSEWTAVGTPGYIAPEVWLREAKADHRIDIYSVGAMLYKLVTGSPPPLAPRLDELQQSGLPPPLIPILATAMARAPKDRYPSAKAMQTALREVLLALSAPKVVPPPPRRLGGLVAASATLAVAALAVLIALCVTLRDEPTQTAPTVEPALESPLAPKTEPAPESEKTPPTQREDPPGTTAPPDNGSGPTSGAPDTRAETSTPRPTSGAPDTKAETSTPAKPKDPPKPKLPAFADKRAELAASLKAFCAAKTGALACIGKLALKREGRYANVKLETKLWFRFAAKLPTASLESRDPRLDLGKEDAFKKCVEAQLRAAQWTLPPTRDGGELACPVAL